MIQTDENLARLVEELRRAVVSSERRRMGLGRPPAGGPAGRAGHANR
ncbi:hypothetical protein [Phenylobacterium sp.]|nr:hypothetical protein [Phenylobacterium sp.]HVI31343.1 hypothetical protein [Phenylobacterium sp.]